MEQQKELEVELMFDETRYNYIYQKSPRTETLTPTQTPTQTWKQGVTHKSASDKIHTAKQFTGCLQYKCAYLFRLID